MKRSGMAICSAFPVGCRRFAPASAFGGVVFVAVLSVWLRSRTFPAIGTSASFAVPEFPVFGIALQQGFQLPMDFSIVDNPEG